MSVPIVAGESRVLFVQYANPAAYPPVEHAARLLAGEGAIVRMIGVAALPEMRVSPHSRVTVDLLPAAAGGWRLRLAFLWFVLRVCAAVGRYRPAWIYASDALSTPAVWLATRLWPTRCVYHEHDVPEGARRGLTARVVNGCRRRLARGADVCVAPSAGRADALRTATGRADVRVVWNTPSRGEVPGAKGSGAGRTRLLYHGSIVPARVPDTLLDALAGLPADVSLCVTGYDPSGGGYLGRLAARARECGLDGRVEFRGPVSRVELMRQCAEFDVGLALLPLHSASVNERTMCGASNKVFDYVACGLAVIVPDLPDWRAAIVEPGYGLACDPASVDSLQRVIGRLHDNPVARWEMGERGRQRILNDWNYERSFRPVLDLMLTRAPATGEQS